MRPSCRQWLRVPDAAELGNGALAGHDTVSTDQVELWLAPLDALAEPLQALEGADPLCPANECDDFDVPRRVARLLLRRLIGRVFGRAAAVLPFANGPHGKPMLAGLAGDFNLSHTRAGDGQSFALIGAGRVAAVGVDLEPERTVRLDVRRRALIIEAAQLVGADAALPDHDDLRILQAWARLEAWGKADGRGIGRTLTHFGIWGGRVEGAAASDEALSGAGRLRVHDLPAGRGLFAAVALPRAVNPPELLFLPTDFASLQAIFAAAGGGAKSGVDLAPGAGQKGTVRSVAQPG